MPPKALALAGALFTAGASAQDVFVPIDALNTCLDTTLMTGGKAAFSIEPGQYLVTLEDNTMFCGSPHDKSCNISSVTFRIEDLSAKKNTAEWGVTVKKPIRVGVYGTVDAPGSAFVIDSDCHDNSGTASLHFHQLN